MDTCKPNSKKMIAQDEFGATRDEIFYIAWQRRD
jgi:hypothetical protein